VDNQPSLSLIARSASAVCLSNMWIVAKRKKDLSKFLYHTKDHLANFSEKKWLVGATSSIPKIVGKSESVERNRAFSIYFRS